MCLVCFRSIIFRTVSAVILHCRASGLTGDHKTTKDDPVCRGPARSAVRSSLWSPGDRFSKTAFHCHLLR